MTRPSPPANKTLGAGPVLVTGATGVIGPALVARLARQGARVRVLTRNPHAARGLEPGVDVVVGDITDADTVQRGVDGCSAVFHLAARLHVNRVDGALADDYRRVNVGGAEVLARAAEQAGVGRLVCFSTINVYGSSAGGAILDEATPPRPGSVYAETKKQAEDVLLAAGRGGGPGPMTTVLRLAAVYGPRMKGNYVHVVRAMRAGWFVPLGNGSNRRTLVHVEDAVTGALLAAEHPSAPGEVFNLTDGAIHTLADITAAIAEALGRRPPRWHIPIGLVRPVATAVDGALAALGKSGAVSPLIDKMGEDMAVSGDRILQRLGFRPRIDLLTGWRTTVAALTPKASQDVQIPN